MFFKSPRPCFKVMLPTLLIMMVLSAIGVAAAVHVGASRLITPKRRPLESRHHEMLETPSEYGLTLESHEVTMGDGVILQSLFATRSTDPGRAEKTIRMEERLSERGIAIPNDCSGTVVLLHGRGGLKENMLSVAQRFVAARYRCIVYDARAHGSSGGKYCTFGKRETGDFDAVIRHYRSLLEERGEKMGQLCAFGNSLGGAVILQSLGEENSIDVAIASAPFAELFPVIERSVSRTISPWVPGWLTYLSLKQGGRVAGFDPFLIEPIRSVAVSTTPLFIVHGSRDGVIPIDHARRLFEAAPEPKRFVEVPAGYHSNVLAEGGDDLYENMIRFCLERRDSLH